MISTNEERGGTAPRILPNRRALRRSLTAWKQAAIGLFVLAVLCNVAQALVHNYLRGQWQTALQQAEESRDSALQELGINKVALGHHRDDAVETFFLSLFYEGRLSCFQPVTYLDRTGITQIRPLLYCGEGTLRNAAARYNLPVVRNPCHADGNTRRQEVKELVARLSKDYPKLKDYVFGAMQRLPLPEWGPLAHGIKRYGADYQEQG